MAAHIFDPESISAARLHVRAAYTNPERLEAHLQSGVRLGLLAPVPTGGYHLTERGHAGVAHLIQTAYEAMSPLQPLPEPDMGRLVDLLYPLVSASLAAQSRQARPACAWRGVMIPARVRRSWCVLTNISATSMPIATTRGLRRGLPWASTHRPGTCSACFGAWGR